MRFEFKTDQNIISDKLSLVLAISIFSFIGILLTNISINLNKLSRNYEINYLCKLILVDKSPRNYRKLSKITNQPNKQKIWDLCREISK